MLQASCDGTNWTNIYTGNSPNLSGWQEFQIGVQSNSYSYYRWSIISKYGGGVQIQEIELIGVGGNEKSFTISGYEPVFIKYPSEELGSLIQKNYQIESVEVHPTEPKSILLTIKDLAGVKNSEGSLTVSYDATKGNLFGIGGVVASFSEIFLPTELLRVPNPLFAEKISASITDFDVNLIPINNKNGCNQDYILASITGFGIILTYTGGIDP